MSAGVLMVTILDYYEELCYKLFITLGKPAEGAGPGEKFSSTSKLFDIK